MLIIVCKILEHQLSSEFCINKNIRKFCGFQRDNSTNNNLKIDLSGPVINKQLGLIISPKKLIKLAPRNDLKYFLYFIFVP